MTFIQSKYSFATAEARSNYQTVLDKPNNSNIKANNIEIKVWENAKNDLARLNYLEINNDIVEDLSNKKKPTAEEVVEFLFLKTSNDVEATQKLVKLLYQIWGVNVLQLVQDVMQHIFPNPHINTEEQKHFIKLDLETQTFKVTHEGLFKINHLNDIGGVADPDEEILTRYLKAKIEISGSLAALKANNVQKLTFLLMHTDAYPDKNSATQDQLYGQKLNCIQTPIQAQYRPQDLERQACNTYQQILNTCDDCTIDNTEISPKIDVPQSVKEDLENLQHLMINKSIVVDLTKDIKLRINTVVAFLYETTSQDIQAAQKLIKLLDKTWNKEMIQLICSNRNDILIDSGNLPQKHIIEVSPEDGRFRVIHEAVFKIVHQDENPTSTNEDTLPGRLKAKMEITGTLANLKENNVQNLEFRLMNTKEHLDNDSAIQDGYNLGGWFSWSPWSVQEQSYFSPL